MTNFTKIFMRKRNNNNDKGFSIVGTLIGVAILSIFAIVTTQYLSNNLSMQSLLKEKETSREIDNVIVTSVFNNVSPLINELGAGLCQDVNLTEIGLLLNGYSVDKVDEDDNDKVTYRKMEDAPHISPIFDIKPVAGISSTKEFYEKFTNPHLKEGLSNSIISRCTSNSSLATEPNVIKREEYAKEVEKLQDLYEAIHSHFKDLKQLHARKSEGIEVKTTENKVETTVKELPLEVNIQKVLDKYNERRGHDRSAESECEEKRKNSCDNDSSSDSCKVNCTHNRDSEIDRQSKILQAFMDYRVIQYDYKPEGQDVVQLKEFAEGSIINSSNTRFKDVIFNPKSQVTYTFDDLSKVLQFDADKNRKYGKNKRFANSSLSRYIGDNNDNHTLSDLANQFNKQGDGDCDTTDYSFECLYTKVQASYNNIQKLLGTEDITADPTFISAVQTIQSSTTGSGATIATGNLCEQKNLYMCFVIEPKGADRYTGNFFKNKTKNHNAVIFEASIFPVSLDKAHTNAPDTEMSIPIIGYNDMGHKNRQVRMMYNIHWAAPSAKNDGEYRYQVLSGMYKGSTRIVKNFD